MSEIAGKQHIDPKLKKNIFVFPTSVVKLTTAPMTNQYSWLPGIVYNSIGTSYRAATAVDITIQNGILCWSNPQQSGYGIGMFAEVKHETEYVIELDMNTRGWILGFKYGDFPKSAYVKKLIDLTDKKTVFQTEDMDLICVVLGTTRGSDFFASDIRIYEDR